MIFQTCLASFILWNSKEMFSIIKVFLFSVKFKSRFIDFLFKSKIKPYYTIKLYHKSDTFSDKLFLTKHTIWCKWISYERRRKIMSFGIIDSKPDRICSLNTFECESMRMQPLQISFKAWQSLQHSLSLHNLLDSSVEIKSYGFRMRQSQVKDYENYVSLDELYLKCWERKRKRAQTFVCARAYAKNIYITEVQQTDCK